MTLTAEPTTQTPNGRSPSSSSSGNRATHRKYGPPTPAFVRRCQPALCGSVIAMWTMPCHPTSIAELGADLLQGATGISGGEWSTDWQVRTSSKILYLLKRLTKIGAVPKKAPPPSPQQDGIWSIPVELPLQPFPASFLPP